MSTRADYIEEIKKLVPGDNLPIGEAEIILAISMGVKEYSKHKPRMVVEDIDGDGGFDYAVSGLDAWSDEFSVIKQVEYPVDDTDETPDILQDDEWMIYETPAGKYLRFLDDTPTATEDIRVTYTGLRTCTDDECTVATIDEEAVQALAASKYCDMLATYYSQTGDSTINADVVDHKSRASEYSSRAKSYRKLYLNHLGIEDGKVPAASVTRDQDLEGSWKMDRLTHPSRHR